MFAARLLDRVELDLVRRGDAFFTVAGTGHEATAALAPHLVPADYLFCHYRDKALLLARGTPAEQFLHGLLCTAQSDSAGRQMCAHLSDPARNVVSMTAPVGNQALHAVGLAAEIVGRPETPIVLCAAGDGATQQGEYLEALGEAARKQLPVLFLIEDNGWAISTPTAGQTFFHGATGPAHECFGIPIIRINGRDPAAAYSAFGSIVAQMRQDRHPIIAILEIDRLCDHTNADDQTIYRSPAEIAAAKATGDPLTTFTNTLRLAGLTERALLTIQADVEEQVLAAAERALAAPEAALATSAKAPLPPLLTDPTSEYRGSADGPRLNMRQALAAVLDTHLTGNPHVSLAGQDIADPKGDVFGVTRGLSTAHPGRVVNAPLSEATIVGTAIGRALVGGRPVAFLQFADFLPLAFNQIACELGTMHWRSNGGWSAPVIVMATNGGYKAGLGPFHAASPEALVLHTPGLDVLMPSTAADAAGLLNAAFASPRPTIFFYPKALLNAAEHATSADVADQFVPIGVARTVRTGRDLTFVAWGNTVGLCQQAAEALADTGVEAEVIDLRSLSPWDEAAVLASVDKTGKLIVVHEASMTVGFGAEVVACVTEKAQRPVVVRRIGRADTLVPFHFRQQIELLPSLRTVVTTAAELFGYEVTWRQPPAPQGDELVVEALGSGPSDESVRLERWLVAVGQTVAAGTPIAEVEASKATIEVAAPVAGVVRALCAEPGTTVMVGQPLLKLQTAERGRAKPISQDRPGTPFFRPKSDDQGEKELATPTVVFPTPHSPLPTPHSLRLVGLAQLAAVTGTRAVTNSELLTQHPDRSSADVVQRTGIETRYWAGPGESALTLATRASREVLVKAGLSVADLDLLICSTGTPLNMTPSLACRLFHELAGERRELRMPAYDLNAACSGYLYALRAAHDFLQVNSAGRVLVVTAEVLSPLLNRHDFDTAFLFGDAASATLVVGAEHLASAWAELTPPELSGKGDDGSTITLPLMPGQGVIQMKGTQVFTEAVRAMVGSLNRACDKAGLTTDRLDMVVPHQANQRILDAVGRRVRPPVYSNIRTNGNTSSSSIPLALRDLLPSLIGGNTVGLCAFGGGFTAGAAVLRVRPRTANQAG
jgi:2-oxoisovalerate dehydrogenase E1 component